MNFTIACATVDPQTESFDPSPLIPYVQSLGVTYHYLSEPIVELAKTKMQVAVGTRYATIMCGYMYVYIYMCVMDCLSCRRDGICCGRGTHSVPSARDSSEACSTRAVGE